MFEVANVQTKFGTKIPGQNTDFKAFEQEETVLNRDHSDCESVQEFDFASEVINLEYFR